MNRSVIAGSPTGHARAPMLYERRIALFAPSGVRRAAGGSRFIAGATVVLLASLLTVTVEGQGGAEQPQARAGEESQGTADGQIEAQLEAKAQRTPAQRKVSSQLLDAYQAVRGQPAANELVTVDIRADVTPAVLERIGTLGGTLINSVPRYRAIRARLPLAVVETLATMDAIQSIRAADQAVTRAAPDAAGTRPANPPEGDVDR